jgi:hypothetical protein
MNRAKGWFAVTPLGKRIAAARNSAAGSGAATPSGAAPTVDILLEDIGSENGAGQAAGANPSAPQNPAPEPAAAKGGNGNKGAKAAAATPEPTPAAKPPGRFKTWYRQVFQRNDAQEAIDEMQRQARERTSAPKVRNRSYSGGGSSYSGSYSSKPVATGSHAGKVALGLGAAAALGWAAYTSARDEQESQLPPR